MTTSNNIKHIVVAGGGTAGWMSAAWLQRFVGASGCRVTLIESEVINTIGVGEATLPALVRFIRNMGYDEIEFMNYCNATFKLGVKFVDWADTGREYWHPFGICGGYIDGVDLFHYWNALRIKQGTTDRYWDYSLQAMLGTQAKLPFPAGEESFHHKAGAYAYHVDAGLFAEYLQGKATAAGVNHIRADIVSVNKDNNGHIASVGTADGQQHEADLYIDCTGFAGLLIEKHLQVPWTDWNHYLLCDRAVVLPMPRPKQFAPYTRSTALSAGWCWTIPLQHRQGNGYVYSSSHKDENAAAEELLAFSGISDSSASDLRQLRMRIGHRQQFWQGNCVAIGLSAGFVEPLESTGIYLIQQGIESLVEFLPDRNFNPVLARSYNEFMSEAYAETRDFILLHYLLSSRKDTDFWRDSHQVPLPDSLRSLLALYRESGNLPTMKVGVFPDTSYYHILAGNGVYPARPLPVTAAVAIARVQEIMRQITLNNANYVQAMPSYTQSLNTVLMQQQQQQ